MKTSLAFIFSALIVTAKANNILVSNVLLSAQNTTDHTTQVNFDIGWENSWRTTSNESNYDGAWIFIKYRQSTTSIWKHATINSTGSIPGPGGTFFVPSDGKGAFIYRNANGIGNVNFAGNQLQWAYGLDELPDNDSVEIKVFALEMVYIPTGAFYLGSGGTESSHFKMGDTNNPYLVSSNNSITLGTTGTNLNPNGKGPVTGAIPGAFPKGYNAFWIMKYECSKQQFVDFLNNLDLKRAQANINFGSLFPGIHPNLNVQNGTRAMSGIDPMNLTAFADWSGLRPMTELEYEKTCRGRNVQPVPNEYAWGNITINYLESVANAGLPSETVLTPLNANANIGNIAEEITRVGLFARPTASTRELSGGAYYGVMNMSDNVSEMCITLHDTTALKMDAAVHGDGYLTLNGDSDVDLFTTYKAFGLKGGNNSSSSASGRISDRGRVDFIYSGSFIWQMGIRLVRTSQ